MSEKQAENAGAEAYRKGMTLLENPFDSATEINLMLAWKKGYEMERDYWEPQFPDDEMPEHRYWGF